MTSGPHLRIVTPPATMVTEPPRQTLRLKLKPKVPTTGYVDGHQVRLGGLHAQHPHTIDLIASSGTRVTLLVVTAARRDNVDSVDELLALTATTGPVPANGDNQDSAMDRWEVDGGLVSHHA